MATANDDGIQQCIDYKYDDEMIKITKERSIESIKEKSHIAMSTVNNVSTGMKSI